MTHDLLPHLVQFLLPLYLAGDSTVLDHSKLSFHPQVLPKLFLPSYLFSSLLNQREQPIFTVYKKIVSQQWWVVRKTCAERARVEYQEEGMSF